MKIYVISLLEDVHRREILQARFKDAYRQFSFITAVGSQDIARSASSLEVNEVCGLLTAPEIACSLSHLLAIKAFLGSGEERCLILEDDAIGEALDIVKIANVMELLPNDAFLLCGGQQGLRGSRYAYGRPTSIVGVYKVPQFARRFYARTCCYCITRQTAEKILKAQRARLSFADSWHEHLRGAGGFFFIDQIRHPEGSEGSHIEGARISAAPSRVQRVIRDGIFKTTMRNSIKLFLIIFSARMGLRRVF